MRPVDSSAARVVPFGRQALLVLPLGAVLELYENLRVAPLPDQLDLVPGAESLLVLFAREPTRGARAELDSRVRRVQVGAVHQDSGAQRATWENSGGRDFLLDDTDLTELVTIDTVYDGPDLDDVAALTGLSPEAVIAVHTATDWQVAFCGFAPGFAYLRGTDPGDPHPRDPHPDRQHLRAPRLTVPRRDSPRPAIDAGSVGLAGPYSGIYPGPSPGGWQLIGRTDAPLWDLRRDPPALLRPGRRVRFRAVRAGMTIPSPTPLPAQPAVSGRAQGARALTVLRPGAQTLVQDLGRAGHASLGVSPSGAADRGAALAANRAVGNPEGAPVLEILLGGAVFEADADLTVALAGAPVPVTVTPAGQSAPAGQFAPVEQSAPAGQSAPAATEPAIRVLRLAAGARLKLGRPRQGLRVYLAVAGGIDVPVVLGSASADVLSHLGPEPLRAGDRLPVGVPADSHAPKSEAPDLAAPRPEAPESESPDAESPDFAAPRPGAQGDTAPGTAALPEEDLAQGVVIVDLTRGPQADPRTLAALTAASWTVSPESNRVAVRLTGPGLEQLGGHTLPSQGLVRGAMQLPPSGELVVFLADYPVTGGYPVIAVAEQVDRLAQVRPGATVRFRMAR